MPTEVPSLTPFEARIVDALRAFPMGRASYHELLWKLYPHDQYPRAWRSSSNGGPPGVAISYGRALNSLHRKGIIYRPPVFVCGEIERGGQPHVSLLSCYMKSA